MISPQWETSLKCAYSTSAADYRASDEEEVNTSHHLRRWRQLHALSCGFGREITVLDAGCGAGRYFHCLANAERLVALDLSPEMLAQAQEPVRRAEVTARHIEFHCANIHSAWFAPGSFDLIYSLGVFGYACPLTAQLLNHFYQWLTDDGVLYFDVSDVALLKPRARIRHHLRGLASLLLPDWMQMRLPLLTSGLPMFALSKRALRSKMKQTLFEGVDIQHHRLTAPGWHDLKLECVARKRPYVQQQRLGQQTIAAEVSPLACAAEG